MSDAVTSDSYLCPHGFDKRSVHCARCADPAFDSARGCEVAKAAMNTMHGFTGGPIVMTDHIPPGTKPTGASKERAYRDALQRIKARVCGEAFPNWENTPNTGYSRGVIADICDMALGNMPTPNETTDCVSVDEHERYKRCLYRANGRLIQMGQEPEKLDYPERGELKANSRRCGGTQKLSVWHGDGGPSSTEEVEDCPGCADCIPPNRAGKLPLCMDLPALIAHNNAAVDLAHNRLIRINELEAQARLNGAVTPETTDWRHKAAEWLRGQAMEQEKTNAECPAHAAAYQSWRDRPLALRLLADRVLFAAQKATPTPSILEEWNAEVEHFKKHGGEMPNDPP